MTIQQSDSTLAEAVRSWGYRTFEASSLAETSLTVDRERPDALLLDVKLRWIGYRCAR